MNGWEDKVLLEKAERAQAMGKLNTTLGDIGAELARKIGAYDAGFEAGVLATENGLGRYDG